MELAQGRFNRILFIYSGWDEGRTEISRRSGLSWMLWRGLPCHTTQCRRSDRSYVASVWGKQTDHSHLYHCSEHIQGVETTCQKFKKCNGCTDCKSSGRSATHVCNRIFNGGRGHLPDHPGISGLFCCRYSDGHEFQRRFNQGQKHSYLGQPGRNGLVFESNENECI